MSYGHASNLLADGTPDPLAELRAAIRVLGKWAELNPSLVELHKDFEACLAGLERGR